VTNTSDPGVDASRPREDGGGGPFDDLTSTDSSNFTAGSPVDVDYRIEFTFVEDPGAILELNATPFLDDITITYVLPTRVLTRKEVLE